MVLNYWAAARAAAGTVGESFEAGSIEDALTLAREAHRDGRLGEVLAASSLLLDGRVLHPDELGRPLADEPVQIDVLPPFAGGRG